MNRGINTRKKLFHKKDDGTGTEQPAAVNCCPHNTELLSRLSRDRQGSTGVQIHPISICEFISTRRSTDIFSGKIPQNFFRCRACLVINVWQPQRIFCQNTILEKRACFSSSEWLKLIGGLGSWLLDQRVGRRVSVLVTWLVYLKDAT